MQEMWDTLSEILFRIIAGNMYVSLDKFKMGQSIVYGGFTLQASVGSPIKILSNKTRLNTLLEISPPTTKAELVVSWGL